MSKAIELDVKVNAKISVDKETAETCLYLLNIYLNSAAVTLNCKTLSEGGVEYFFESLGVEQ